MPSMANVIPVKSRPFGLIWNFDGRPEVPKASPSPQACITEADMFMKYFTMNLMDGKNLIYALKLWKKTECTETKFMKQRFQQLSFKDDLPQQKGPLEIR